MTTWLHTLIGLVLLSAGLVALLAWAELRELLNRNAPQNEDLHP